MQFKSRLAETRGAVGGDAEKARAQGARIGARAWGAYEELDVELLADELLCGGLAGEKVGAGEEGAQALDEHHRPATVDRRNLALDRRVVGVQLREGRAEATMGAGGR